eukprot:3065878-Rhodomonas_salina.1
MLLDGDGLVYDVKYGGKTDIADSELKPMSKRRTLSESADPFKAKANAWEARVKARLTVQSLKEEVEAAKTQAAGKSTHVEPAQKEKTDAEKEEAETSKAKSSALE